MNRDQIDNQVKIFYETRSRNSAADVLALFASDAQVRLAGAVDASRIAHQTTTPDELSNTVSDLVGTWQWINVEMLSVLIEGNSAAARYIINAKHKPSGEEITAECMDQFFFDDIGKIKELIEFVDTAKVAQLDG